jgi:DNA-binding response OmpR family regulator
LFASTPRIALADLGLPNVDGFAVAERLRSFVPGEELALVALKGATHADDLLRVVESDFDAYLPRPISFDRLVAVITERLAILARAGASA